MKTLEMQPLKVAITITRNGAQGYVCTCDYPFVHFDLGGCGATVDEAKQDCFTFYDEMRREYPADRLPDLEVEWVYDLARTRSDADLVDAAVMA